MINWIYYSFMVAVAFNGLVFDVAAAQPVAEDAQAESRESFRLEETGEKRRCLIYSKIEGLTYLGENTFLFVYAGGKYYVNTTQSGCPYNPASDPKIKFEMRSGNVCRNTVMRINTSNYKTWTPLRCTLSEFREAVPVGPN